uniref:UPAR/Ly6 domain-containing protein n=1 Tax=Glossina brevipalpis TaxID=37001 RepID=A0A1A9W920_9MUSC
MEYWRLFVTFLTLFCYCFSYISALDCYVCTNQTGNVEKCLNTLRTCEPGEDVCGTEIRWGSLPYFSQGALKQYYVSKRCMTKQQCQSKRKRHMPYCTHIWYEDWSCHECCQGDRCNYFIISKGLTLSTLSSFTLAVTSLILSTVFIQFLL